MSAAEPGASPPAVGPGSRLGPYEVIAPLGAGGMGDVFRARDLRLGREVAVKVLPVELAAHPDRVRRFEQEARAASALNHPHILTVHDVGTVDSRLYIVTELVEGRTLRDLLAAGPLPLRRALELAVQIASGLAKAHAAGIVHRDLKPENVMVTPDGFVKILDFGLAKLAAGEEDSPAAPAPAESITHTNAVLGTVGYMSPEQARGDPVDVRADQFSFGAVLYEMLAGRRAFRRPTPVGTLTAILHDEPEPVARLVPGLPSELTWMVERCLAKHPEGRYASTRDLVRDLERVREQSIRTSAAGAPSPPAKSRWRTAAVASAALLLVAVAAALMLRSRTAAVDSLAVLPFANASGDPGMEYLSDGIAESLINSLSRLPRLRVMARSTVFRFKGKADDPQQIGGELKVKAVLAGRLVRRGDRLVVSTELVDVGTGAVLWGEQYDRSFSDILLLQQEIVRRISDNLRLKLSEPEQSQLARRPTDDVTAYEHYLKGRWSLARQTEPDTRYAVDEFEAALRIDPRFAEAQASLAVASAQMGFRYAGEAETATWRRRGEEAKRRALELDPNLAETHEALAFVYSSSEFDWDRTIAEGRRALEINRHLPMPHLYIARAFYHLGLFAEAKREVEAGVALDPAYKVEPLRIRGNTALLEGNFEDAVLLLDEALGLSRSAAEWWLTQAYYYTGRRDHAEVMLQALAMSPTAQSMRRSQATLASFLAARGERARARQLIDEVTGGTYMDHHVAYSLGAAHSQLGQPAEARRWLAQAAETGFPCYPWYARDPLLNPLRHDPAFQAFLAGLREKWNATRARYADVDDLREERREPGADPGRPGAVP
jgi:serine/threonine protein kinase/tetratricopeptide (TPR) repeat protein